MLPNSHSAAVPHLPPRCSARRTPHQGAPPGRQPHRPATVQRHPQTRCTNCWPSAASSCSATTPPAPWPPSSGPTTASVPADPRRTSPAVLRHPRRAGGQRQHVRLPGRLGHPRRAGPGHRPGHPHQRGFPAPWLERRGHRPDHPLVHPAGPARLPASLTTQAHRRPAPAQRARAGAGPRGPSIGNVWPLTIVQMCIIHLIRNTFRTAPGGHRHRSSRWTRSILNCRRPGGASRSPILDSEEILFRQQLLQAGLVDPADDGGFLVAITDALGQRER